MKINECFASNLKTAAIHFSGLMFTLIALLACMKILDVDFQCSDTGLVQKLILAIGLLVAFSLLIYFYYLLGHEKDEKEIVRRLRFAVVIGSFTVIIATSLWFINKCFTIPPLVYFLPVVVVVLAIRIFIDNRRLRRS